MEKPNYEDIGECRLTPEIFNSKVKIVVDMVGGEEQTTKFLNADELRDLADYLDSSTVQNTSEVKE